MDKHIWTFPFFKIAVKIFEYIVVKGSALYLTGYLADVLGDGMMGYLAYLA